MIPRYATYDFADWHKPGSLNCLRGYPKLVSNYSGNWYVNHNKLKRLFQQITRESIKVPRILFFISEQKQNILEENYTKLCLAN